MRKCPKKRKKNASVVWLFPSALARARFEVAHPIPPLLQAVELLVPAIIMLLIGSLKNGLTTEELDAATPITDTPVVTYEAMQSVDTFPNVLCYDNNMFMRYLGARMIPPGCPNHASYTNQNPNASQEYQPFAILVAPVHE